MNKLTLSKAIENNRKRLKEIAEDYLYYLE